eukprot:6224706-Prymnesium_polylepis.1
MSEVDERPRNMAAGRSGAPPLVGRVEDRAPRPGRGALQGARRPFSLAHRASSPARCALPRYMA